MAIKLYGVRATRVPCGIVVPSITAWEQSRVWQWDISHYLFLFVYFSWKKAEKKKNSFIYIQAIMEEGEFEPLGAK